MGKQIRKDPRGAKKTEVQRKRRDTVLLLLSAAFLIGGAAGGLLASRLSPALYLTSFWDTAAQGVIQPSLWRELWVVFRWPMAAAALALLPLAGVTLPVLFFLRGLFLAYGAAALLGGFTGSEILCAALVLGPGGLLTVPALFLFGTAGLLRRSQGSWGSGIRPLLLALPALVLCVVLDQMVVPKLLTVLLKGFSAAGG